MRRTFVPPSGDPEATFAICGEQPGMQEVRSIPPKPFVGPAGQALDECLVMTKILRRDLYLTNVIKDLDAPLKHYIDIDTHNKYVIHPDGYQYIQELGEELKRLKLNVIVALGNIALLALTSRIGITKWRGSVLDSTLVPGLKVIPTFHPATFIPPKFNFLNRPLICEDLLRAKNESDFEEVRRASRSITIHPSFDQSIHILNHCYEVGLRGQTLGIDIEVINGEVDCIAFGWSPYDSACIPFRSSQGDYFNPDEELEIMRLISKIIQEERISKVGASFIFDLQFLLHKYGIRPKGHIHCTQIAQKIAFPDFSAGLDFVTTMHTDIPYYKADGKQWMKMGAGTWEQWWNYNGMDGLVPVDALPKQLETLRKQGNLDTYHRQKNLIPPLIYMSERGIKIDVQGMITYRDEQQVKLDALIKQLNEEVGHEINHNSPQQLMNYFYKECNLKPYKKKNTQGTYVDTSDVDALKRIFRRGGPGSIVARIMLDIRSLEKRKSTYLNVGKVDKDGRYRSSYKPVGAETGRLSSGETIFGTGGNQQNWPHDLLRFFIFDEGYIGYSFDLSQIENRIVAYVGGVIPQIQAFEQGIDLHRMTGSVIFDKPYDQISDKDGSSDIGDGRHSERYWGKKGNHAINYDVGYKTFALKNEMPEGEAKYILEKIHKGYPQIRGGYHVIIQEMLKQTRTITNLFGRSRLFLGPVIPSFPNNPKSACEDTYREGYAQMAQSTCADKINEQGVEFIYYNQDLFRPIELLAQIHDSIVFQIPLCIPWESHAQMLLWIKQSLETPLIWHETEIKTPVDLSIGFNMCKEQMIELKSKAIPNDINLLAERLKESYDKLLLGPDTEHQISGEQLPQMS
jgi:uracil-DNA glycosylase family 4